MLRLPRVVELSFFPRTEHVAPFVGYLSFLLEDPEHKTGYPTKNCFILGSWLVSGSKEQTIRLSAYRVQSLGCRGTKTTTVEDKKKSLGLRYGLGFRG